MSNVLTCAKCNPYQTYHVYNHFLCNTKGFGTLVMPFVSQMYFQYSFYKHKEKLYLKQHSIFLNAEDPALLQCPAFMPISVEMASIDKQTTYVHRLLLV